MLSVRRLRLRSTCTGPGVPSKSGRLHFPVRLWIEGSQRDLDSIEFVTYRLHPSFKNPVRVGTERSRDFEVRIRTWGFFDVRITVVGHDGHKYEMSGRVTFDPERPKSL